MPARNRDRDAVARATAQLMAQSAAAAPASVQSYQTSTANAVAAEAPALPAPFPPQVTGPAAASVIAVSRPLVAATDPRAPAAPLTLVGVLELMRREIDRTFFNKTPTLAHNWLENSLVDGRIVGNLNPADRDGDILTYTTTDPSYGAVEVLADGSFTYTPASDYPGHDTFNVTVSDAGNGFHIHGLPGLLHLVTFGLLGNDGHTDSATVTVGYPSLNPTPQVSGRNGWLAFEVISAGDNPGGDGFDWAMPQTFDGLGAHLPDDSTLRLYVNHEVSDATISEVDLDLASFKTAIDNTINTGNTGPVSFVRSARQAYQRWTSDGGSSWTSTSDPSNTSFSRFCSGQSYLPNTFGDDRGFVDAVFMTGEEVGGGRLVAIDLTNRDLYQISGVAGDAGGGIGGMPFDSWENAALVDTGETAHVAILLSPDGGTRNLTMYVGQKGINASGAEASDFLSRNGLAFGSYYYLNATLPAGGTVAEGTFDTTVAGALNAAKLEDVDTSPCDPTRVVLAVQETGLFTFRFQPDFSSGNFDAAGSSFTITKIQNHTNDTDGLFGDADNVDWTAPTAFGGQSFPDGLIFVNEDSGTGNGETWMMRPDGSGLIKIADTIGISTASETSGVLDVSALVGYQPGSVLLISNQGSKSSLTVLINPEGVRL